jgi:hypothetical protein
VEIEASDPEAATPVTAAGRCQTWGYQSGHQCLGEEGHEGRHWTELVVGRFSAGQAAATASPGEKGEAPDARLREALKRLYESARKTFADAREDADLYEALREAHAALADLPVERDFVAEATTPEEYRAGAGIQDAGEPLDRMARAIAAYDDDQNTGLGDDRAEAGVLLRLMVKEGLQVFVPRGGGVEPLDDPWKAAETVAGVLVREKVTQTTDGGVEALELGIKIVAALRREDLAATPEPEGGWERAAPGVWVNRDPEPERKAEGVERHPCPICPEQRPHVHDEDGRIEAWTERWLHRPAEEGQG